MMSCKSLQQIEKIQASCDFLSKLHGFIAEHLEIGISTQFLDDVAASFLQKEGLRSSFKGLYGCPSHILVSVNHAVVHGLPSGYIIQPGDVVSVDAGVYYEGYHSDSAFTYLMPGKVDQKLVNLLSAAEEALAAGIEACKVGNRVGSIGHAIQTYVESRGYQVVKDYGGHGVGKLLHEEPCVPNFGSSNYGPYLQEGMVLAIEPLVTMLSDKVYKKSVGVFAKDGLPSAHFEHTVAIINGKAQRLTSFEYIKEVLKNKKYDL